MRGASPAVPLRLLCLTGLCLTGLCLSACPKDEAAISPAPDPVGAAVRAAPAAAPSGLPSAAADPAPSAPEARKVPLEAEIQKATAVEATKQKRYEQALAAAEKAVELAPEWADGYLARASIYLALAGSEPQAAAPPVALAPAMLAGSAWAVINFGDAQTWRFQRDGVLRCEGECADRLGSWRIEGGAVRISLATGVLTGTLEEGRLKGTGSDHTNGEIWSFSGTLKEGKLGAAPAAGGSGSGSQDLVLGALSAAARDFETYLKLAPHAPDWEAVLTTIGQLKVRISAWRGAQGGQK